MASIRCVRPDFTTSENSADFRSSEAARCSSAGIRSAVTAAVAAMWIDDGNTSFDDWDALTWSLGWTSRPSRSPASVATTSLVFMLDDVPEPVWKTSTGKCSSQRPSATSAAASWIASAMSGSSTFSSAFTLAAAALIRASASMWARSSRCPEIGKFSTARWVCARHLACAGTFTSPIESCSTRYVVSSAVPSMVFRPPDADEHAGCSTYSPRVSRRKGIRGEVVGRSDAAERAPSDARPLLAARAVRISCRGTRSRSSS